MNYAPHPVTLRQLQYIVAVAEWKSFRQAAENCHVAQPSLSAQIAQVEEVLGIQFFERNRSNVIVTTVGQVFVERARALLIAADELIHTARTLTDPFSGALRIGVIPTIGPYLLPEITPVLRERYPKLTFLWTEEKTHILIEQLMQARLDAALVALGADVDKFPRVVVGKDQFMLATSIHHPLATSKRSIKPEELQGERVLLLNDGHCLREQALSFCSQVGVEESSYRATSLPTLVQMVASGVGVTLLPKISLAVENRYKTLHVRSFAPKAPIRTLALIWRKHSALESVFKAIGETLRALYLQATVTDYYKS